MRHPLVVGDVPVECIEIVKSHHVDETLYIFFGKRVSRYIEHGARWSGARRLLQRTEVRETLLLAPYMRPCEWSVCHRHRR